MKTNQNDSEKEQFKKVCDAFEDAAFPVNLKFQSEENINVFYDVNIKGLSKREYFAAMAMQGFLSAGMAVDSLFHSNSHNKDHSCAIAVKYADALIEALNKNEGK